MESTCDRLIQMRFSMTARAYREQSGSPSAREMGFDERLALLVDAEWDARRSNKRTRLLRAAGFPEPGANVEDVRYDLDRKPARAQIAELSNCGWARSRRHVVLCGALGCGKTCSRVRSGSPPTTRSSALATHGSPRCPTSCASARTKSGRSPRSATSGATCSSWTTGCSSCSRASRRRRCSSSWRRATAPARSSCARSTPGGLARPHG